MGDREPLNIRVIYTASKSERKRIKKEAARIAAAPSTPAETAPRPAEPTPVQNPNAPTIALDLSSTGIETFAPVKPREATRAVILGSRSAAPGWLPMLGLLNVLAAALFCYGTWWQGDRYVFDVFLFKTPLPLAQEEADAIAAQIFGIPKKDVETGSETESPRFVGDTARAIIGVSGYGWLTLSTIAACLVSMAGGTLLAVASGRIVRVFATILVIAVVGALGWGTYATWTEFGRMFPTDRVRMGYAGLTGLAFFMGLAWGGRARMLNRLAGFAVVVAAMASAAGLLLVSECNALNHPGHAAPLFLAAVFAVHSSYGWLLLFSSRRMTR